MRSPFGRERARVASLALLSAGLSLACGGATDNGAGSSGSVGASGGFGNGGLVGASSGASNGGSASSSGGSSGGMVSADCPAAPPVNGAPCTPPWSAEFVIAAHCSWGDDPRPSCRTSARCSDGVWVVSDQLGSVAGGGVEHHCSAPPLPAACSLGVPPPNTVCSEPSVVNYEQPYAISCWYDGGTHCDCSSCVDGNPFPHCLPLGSPEWFCHPPDPGCPAFLPQAGAACSSLGTTCLPDCTLTISCLDSVWTWAYGFCPICAAPTTPIATPSGERPIASLVPGDLVYSVDHDAITVVPIARVTKTRVVSHRVMQVVLDDGRTLEISPGHPLADGSRFADLKAGAKIDPEHYVRSAELVRYRFDATYDILPASSTGTYFAAGAWIGSTLFADPSRAGRLPIDAASCR